ncbi:biotin transporter BioY [Peptostreptococcus faecalis]|uniref:biotin transporter BioY n=1 Tax=Peptostreptococcus faecalis TaxID=2045015 RepID=UPI001FA82CC7|nr:biotin transporter BioY [Peptostreptococcus faecalis]
MKNNILNSNTNFLSVRTMIFCSLFTTLVAVGAFIRIPLPVTVFTMQFLFVLMSGLILGSKRGSLSCFLYVAIGILGFPVFTEGGGPMYILKPTFGYLIAFIFAAFLVGYLKEKFGSDSTLKLSVYCVIAMVNTYIIGSLYTYFILNYVMGTPIKYWMCLASLFPATFLKDLFSCFIAAASVKKLSKHVKNLEF